MTYSKLLGMLAAVAVTSAGLFAFTAPVSAKGKPIVVVARQAEDVPTRRVSYADLNLASLSGEKMLTRRVTGAVRSVCNESVGDGGNVHDYFDCRSFAWAGARPQMTLAIQRARQIARAGSSSIAAVAITISTPQ